MPAGSLTLAAVAVAERAAVLAVACKRCDRAGRYPLATLIERHGPLFGIPRLLWRLSADCPKRQAVSVYDQCGVRCPDLPRLFGVVTPG